MADFVKTPDGTPAGYQPPSEGPFRCDNCEHFIKPNKCNKPELIEELGKDIVDPAGCCNFYEKGSSGMPISEYYKGSGDKVMSSMAKTYGKKKGKQVFYATANKNDMVGPSSSMKKKHGVK